jgi:antitoxin component of MazEF toxin-antitoxin module
MAKPSKKQTTPKSTETDQIVVATVDLPKTPEQAMDELTELSQELGLYDVEGNPLVKDESTMPVEAPTEAVESVQEEMNTDVAKEDEIDSSIGLEPLNATEELDELLDDITDENKHPELIPSVEVDSPPVDDKLTLKDAWGRPVPTTLITLQTVNYTELVSQVLYLAYLGAELDKSYRIMTTVPYRLRLLLPTENYDKWISKEDVMVYDDNVSYNKVLVRGFSLYPFWDNVVKVGKSGAMVVPRTVAQKVAGYMVSCYTRAPIADTPESRVSLSKIKYTKEELEGFTLESLKIVASWYEGIPSMNSKIKYIKEILVKQGG